MLRRPWSAVAELRFVALCLETKEPKKIRKWSNCRRRAFFTPSFLICALHAFLPEMSKVGSHTLAR